MYSALVLQTRLKPYLDAIELTIDERGIGFDATALATKLDAYRSASEREALIDLVELNRYALPTLQAVGFAGLDTLRGWIEGLPAGSSLRADLAALNVYAGAATAGSAQGDIYLGDASGNTFSGAAGDDIAAGSSGNDTLYGDDGADTLLGQDGADMLYGQAGADALTGGAGADSLYGASQYGGGAASGDNDTLDGEAGNDYLVGGFGSDTYLFGAGGGQDVINNDADGWNGYADPDANKQDVLQFKDGVLASDVSASRSGDNLILKINGSTDQVTVQNYFSQDGLAARGWAIDQIKFADGTTWAVADVKAKVLLATAGNDALIGYATDDSFSGLAGNDSLEGRAGKDTLDGNEGDDSLDGGSDADTLIGGDGADRLYGQTGADMLTGGAGADSLYGASQYGGGAASGDNDTLDGEAGNDYLVGGFGSDTYLFGAGGGQDVINNDSDSWNGYADPDANKRDVLQFKSGVLAGDVSASRSSDNLILKINGTTDQVTIQNYFSQDGVSARGWAVEQIKFADGTAWALADVKAKVLVPTAGNDTLIGYATADTLSGGAGADTLQGGSGNDTYGLGRGGGSDTIAENDATAGNTDVALFGPDIAADQLWFRQVGSHLEVSVIGSTDKFTVSNWYSGNSYHVEQFKTANGKVLLDTQVQNLVQAMAGFAPPASGQTTLPASYQSSLNPIIAANWH